MYTNNRVNDSWKESLIHVVEYLRKSKEIIAYIMKNWQGAVLYYIVIKKSWLYELYFIFSLSSFSSNILKLFY